MTCEENDVRGLCGLKQGCRQAGRLCSWGMSSDVDTLAREWRHLATRSSAGGYVIVTEASSQHAAKCLLLLEHHQPLLLAALR